MAMRPRPSSKAADKEAQAKNAALQAAVTQIEKDFGQGSVMRLGDKGHVDVDAIPTGALSLDLALGVGGVPAGRIVEIFGRSRPARRPSSTTSSPRRRPAAESARSSTPSTRSTRSTRRRSG